MNCSGGAGGMRAMGSPHSGLARLMPMPSGGRRISCISSCAPRCDRLEGDGVRASQPIGRATCCTPPAPLAGCCANASVRSAGVCRLRDSALLEPLQRQVRAVRLAVGAAAHPQRLGRKTLHMSSIFASTSPVNGALMSFAGFGVRPSSAGHEGPVASASGGARHSWALPTTRRCCSESLDVGVRQCNSSWKREEQCRWTKRSRHHLRCRPSATQREPRTPMPISVG